MKRIQQRHSEKERKAMNQAATNYEEDIKVKFTEQQHKF